MANTSTCPCRCRRTPVQPTAPGFFQVRLTLPTFACRHDPDKKGAMSMSEFIRLTLFLQSCVRSFSAFDPQVLS